MKNLFIEFPQAVQFLGVLRTGLQATEKRARKRTFTGVVEALKGLGLVERKGEVKGLWEGLDRNGDHWFMVEGDEAPAGVPPGAPERFRTLPPELEKEFTKRFENAQAAQYYLQAIYTLLGDHGWAFCEPGAAGLPAGAITAEQDRELSSLSDQLLLVMGCPQLAKREGSSELAEVMREALKRLSKPPAAGQGPGLSAPLCLHEPPDPSCPQCLKEIQSMAASEESIWREAN